MDTSIIVLGFLTGIGAGLANGLSHPVGSFIYKKYLEPKLRKVDKHLTSTVKKLHQKKMQL